MEDRPAARSKPAQPAAPKTYYVETWGCQMNVHDSEKLSGSMEAGGYARAASADDADVVLLNTCSIREKAAEKVFTELGRLRNLKQKNPGMIIGVCGCVAQQEGEKIFRRAPHVDIVLGPRATASLENMLLKIQSGEETMQLDTELRLDSIRYPFDAIRRESAGSGKAYVTIIEGCNHSCSYCVVPATRGRQVCRDMDQILDEVRALAQAGVIEIEFLGQTVNAYRDEDGRRLHDLLDAASEIGGIGRIRFTTSHPSQMTDRLMDAMAANSPVVCPYLHLPVQSGSSRVLRDMRRGYDRERYLEKIDGLRRRIPEISIGTDIIVGFPTETENDFLETVSLLDEVRFDNCYSFFYSPRPGTTALELADPVPLAEKQDRLARLQQHQKGIQELNNAALVGRVEEILVEGESKRDSTEWTGRTGSNRVVNFAGPSGPGRVEKVTITRSTAFSLRGELLITND